MTLYIKEIEGNRGYRARGAHARGARVTRSLFGKLVSWCHRLTNKTRCNNCNTMILKSNTFSKEQ